MYLDVLKAISKGYSRPTRIMCKGNLTWNRSKIILKTLADRGLIGREEHRGRTTYCITERGRQVVDSFQELRMLLETKT